MRLSLRQKAHAREVNMSALVNTAPRHAQPDEFISQIVMMFMVAREGEIDHISRLEQIYKGACLKIKVFTNCADCWLPCARRPPYIRSDSGSRFLTVYEADLTDDHNIGANYRNLGK